MVISSRVVACTSRSVAFNGNPSTRGRLTGLRNEPQKQASETSLRNKPQKQASAKADLSTFGSGVLVIS